MSYGKGIGVVVAPGVAPPAFVGTASQTGVHAGLQTGMHTAAGSVGHALTTGLAAAAPFLAGVAVAAGAVMMTRAGLMALADLDARIEAETQAWRQVTGEARRWQSAYARLVDCNARIAQLKATARRLGPDAGPLPPLPASFDPFGPGSDPAAVTAETVQQWCDTVEKELPTVDEAVRKARIAAARRPLPADSPAARHAERVFAERLGRLLVLPPPAPMAVPAVGPAVEPAAVASAEVRAQVWDGVRNTLEELRGQAAVAGWQNLLTCAEQVRLAGGRQSLLRASHEFYALAQQFRQDQAERVEQARQAATYLAVLVPGQLPPAAAGVIERLEAVAAQSEPLDPQTRKDAEILLNRQHKATEARYSLAALQHALAEQGYDADLDLTGMWPQVTLTRDGRPAGRLDWVGHGVEATFQPGGAVSLPDWARDVTAATEAVAADGVTARIVRVQPPPEATPGATAQRAAAERAAAERAAAERAAAEQAAEDDDDRAGPRYQDSL
jgi:hypothetical protein